MKRFKDVRGIPDDVMLEVGVLLTSGRIPSGRWKTAHALAASVLMIERERCAGIVLGSEPAAGPIVHDIAAEIRNPFREVPAS